MCKNENKPLLSITYVSPRRMCFYFKCSKYIQGAFILLEVFCTIDVLNNRSIKPGTVSPPLLHISLHRAACVQQTC